MTEEYLKEFEKLNKTTESIYDLGKHEVLIILKDGTNLTSWKDVNNKADVLYVSEDLSKATSLGYKYENLTEVKLIIARNVTSEVTSLSHMFANCQSLTDIIGMQTWDVSKVYSLQCMFGWCESLNNFRGMEDWDVSSVSDMTEMFCACNLTNVRGLEKWDTSNVTTMNKMFKWCAYLTDLSALKNWNVTGLENMSRMFWGCKKLEDLSGLSNWDVSNVKEMTYTFIYCFSLTNVDDISDWDVSGLENTRSMFDKCTSLENINGTRTWNFDNILTLERMFDDCSSLVDVSASESWNIEDKVNTGAIFRRCPKIQSNPFERKLKINTSGPKDLNVDKQISFMYIYGTGWASIRLGDIYSRASYITDVPGDCLRSMIKAIKEDCDFNVYFNAEGYSFHVEADNEQCYFNFDGGEQHEFDNMNKYDLAIKIYENINSDSGSWDSFYHSNSRDIYELLDELKELIEEF